MTALNNLAAADQAVIGGIATSNGALKTDFSNVAGVLPVADGGTGSSTQNFVDLTTTQNVAGAKTFTTQLVGKGTATNDSAATGYIGEWNSVSVVVGSAVALTSTAAKDIVTVSLPPGDYDVRGNFAIHPNTLSALTTIGAGLTITTNTLPTLGSVPGAVLMALAFNAAVDHCFSLAETRFSLAATTTVRLVGRGDFTGTGLGGYGVIEWRRVR